MAAEYRWENFRLDLDAYRLERAGTPLPLEPKAFSLLVLMVRQPHHLFTKQELFEAIWPDTAVTDHALTRIVAQLRRALGDEAREARYIETVPTRGYRWIRPVEEGPPAPVIREVDQQPTSLAAPSRPYTPRVAAIVAATAVLALLVWALRSSTTSEAGGLSANARAGTWRASDVPQPVQLTTHGGLDLNPAVSPQGDALAYASDRTGSLELYVRALSGAAAESPLTNDGGQNVQPSWSSDGRYVAYHSNKMGGIWIIPARGGTARQLAPAGSNPVWSPDGTRIAFQSDENTDVTPSAFGAQSGSTIWAVNIRNGGLTQLTRNGQPMGGHAAPAWSHDGRYLAFTVFEGGEDEGAWLLALDSGTTRPLSTGSKLYEVAFGADDRSIFAAGGESFVVRLPFDPATGTVRGAREVIPVAGVPGVRGLSITGDGKRLAFAGLALSSQIWMQPIDRDGSMHGAARALTSDTSRRNSFAAVSPDGSKVAYVATRNGELPNVLVMDVDGGNRLQVTADETGEARPSWFPDGRRVAYSSYRGETRGVFAVDLATRREEMLLDLARTPMALRSPALKGRFAELQLSPSSTQAAFSLVTPPTSRRVLYVTGVAAPEPRAITDGSQSIGYPSWSPDERLIAVEIKDGSSTHAGIIDLRSGTLRQITHEKGQTWVRSWSPDGKKIAAATLREGVWSLQWIDVTSGETGEISPSSPPNVYLRYPDWSPRGTAVVFERGELRGNIWMLPIP